MIVLLTGAPGSGKTYRAVKLMLDELKNGNIVCSNIDGIKKEKIPNSENLIIITNDLVYKKTQFFEYKNIESFIDRIRQKKGDKKIIFVIDEAQRFLGRYAKLNQEVIFTFDYHRHLNIDFYLITQDKTKISRDIYVLAEFEIRAVRRSTQLLNRFKYKYLLDNEEFKSEVLKPSDDIFQLYSSFQVSTADTTRYFAYTKLLLTLSLFFSFAVASFLYLRHLFLPSSVHTASRELPSSRNTSSSLPLSSSHSFHTASREFPRSRNTSSSSLPVKGVVRQGSFGYVITSDNRLLEFHDNLLKLGSRLYNVSVLEKRLLSPSVACR